MSENRQISILSAFRSSGALRPRSGGVRGSRKKCNGFAMHAWVDADGQMSETRGRLTSGVRLWFYGLALRFKRCPLTSDRRSLTPEAPANRAKGVEWPNE